MSLLIEEGGRADVGVQSVMRDILISMMLPQVTRDEDDDDGFDEIFEEVGSTPSPASTDSSSVCSLDLEVNSVLEQMRREDQEKKVEEIESSDEEFHDVTEEVEGEEDETEKPINYLELAKETMYRVLGMLSVSHGWNKEREEADGLTVKSQNFEGIGKVLKLEAYVDCSAAKLADLAWGGFESQADWNTEVEECSVLEEVNSNVEVTYTRVRAAGGGLVSPRDFVVLRHFKQAPPLSFCVSVSVKTPLMPEQPNLVRGENGPGGMIIRELDGEENRCKYIWLLNSDIKGWIPQRLVDSSLSDVMIGTFRSMSAHLTTL